MSALRQSLKLAFLVLLAVPGLGQSAPGEWVHYGGSERGRQYSDATQIDTGNVDQLEIAWTFRTGELSENSTQRYAFQSNPILVDGLLYVTTGTAIVFALDPVTGEEVWHFDPQLDREMGRSEIANRGVSSWIDPQARPGTTCRHRIFVATLDSRMIALDGKSGQLCTDFADKGQLFLNKDVRIEIERRGHYGVTSPPVILGDTLVTGSAIGDNAAVELPLGVVRGIDARTGAIRWSWDPVPRDPADPEHGSWREEEVRATGAANAWAPLAADSDLNMVYVPTGSASPDFYGGEREGDNRYANSLVALDASTGEVVWHQQLVHHDVWDYDLPAQPTLVELRRGDEVIPAVLQATKMGLIFTFNRLTGEPIFEIEERPVPQGGVEGEHLSPTQPFPVAPPPIVRHAPVTSDDAFGLLIFDEMSCANDIESYRSEGIYTPPTIGGSIMMPGYAGGVNWGGIAFDPGSQIAVANATDAAAIIALVPRGRFMTTMKSGQHPDSEFAPQRGTPYGMRREIFLSPIGMPCTQPPWGTLTALNMTTGTIKWQVPLGTVEDVAPAFFPNIRYGVPSMGGPIITAGGLIFIGATMDDYLRAFDIETGEKLWEARLPAGGQATPMTYYLEQTGKQYVVIAAGGHPKLGTKTGDYLVAFALDETAAR